MTEKSKNWLCLALMMTSLRGTGTKYEFFYPLKCEIENFAACLKISCKIPVKILTTAELFIKICVCVEEAVVPPLPLSIQHSG